MKDPLSIVGKALLGILLFLFFALLSKTGPQRKTHYARLGILLSLALVFGFIEATLPDLFVPGVKLGLANVVILLVLFVYGPRESLFLAFAKALLVSFLTGSFLSMGGWMSLVGSLLSCLAMIFLHFLARSFSPIGVSLLGALSHILGQLLIAYAYLGVGVWAYAPLALPLALATGVLTGGIAALLLRQRAFLAYLRDGSPTP